MRRDLTSRLKGRRLLVVEDDFFIADDMRHSLEEAGADVIGPVASVQDALELLAQNETCDGAVLDVNLRGETSYAVADELAARDIRYVFTTGYDADRIPARYADIMRYQKPVEMGEVVAALVR